MQLHRRYGDNHIHSEQSIRPLNFRPISLGDNFIVCQIVKLNRQLVNVTHNAVGKLQIYSIRVNDTGYFR